jgi:hypothetical protein
LRKYASRSGRHSRRGSSSARYPLCTDGSDRSRRRRSTRHGCCPACARTCPRSMVLCRPRPMPPRSGTRTWQFPSRTPCGTGAVPCRAPPPRLRRSAGRGRGRLYLLRLRRSRDARLCPWHPPPVGRLNDSNRSIFWLVRHWTMVQRDLGRDGRRPLDCAKHWSTDGSRPLRKIKS